jgi:hypothetical protein
MAQHVIIVRMAGQPQGADISVADARVLVAAAAASHAAPMEHGPLRLYHRDHSSRHCGLVVGGIVVAMVIIVCGLLVYIATRL